MNHLALISALEPPWAHLVARCLEEALQTSRVSFAVLPPGSSGTKTEPCSGLFLTNCHQSCMFFLTFVTAVFYTFATIRYYSDRGTSVVRTLRPNLVASSLLIPNFSLADQVLEIFRTSSCISFLSFQFCRPGPRNILHFLEHNFYDPGHLCLQTGAFDF